MHVVHIPTNSEVCRYSDGKHLAHESVANKGPMMMEYRGTTHPGGHATLHILIHAQRRMHS